MKILVKIVEDLKAVGIVQPSEDANGALLRSGIYYPAELTDHVIEEAKNSKIVKAQMKNEDIDVLISFLNRYDIDKIKTKNSLLIKIAWVINWFEWWVNKSYFESYDIVLVSNTEGIKYIEKNTVYKPIQFPKATDTSMYNSKVESVKKYECDYCFAGNYWDDRERDLVNSLVPEDIPYDFNLYGNWWDKTKL